MTHRIPSLPNSFCSSTVFDLRLGPEGTVNFNIQLLKKSAEQILQKIDASAQKLKYQNYDSNHPETLKKVSFLRYSSWEHLGTLALTGFVSLALIQNFSLFVMGLPTMIFGALASPSLVQGLKDTVLPGNRLLVRSLNQISKDNSKFFSPFVNKIFERGVCKGEVELLNYLFFASKANFNCEESKIIRIAKFFLHGGPKEAGMLQLIPLRSENEMRASEVMVRVYGDGLKNAKRDLIEGLRSLPPGSYNSDVVSSTRVSHAFWLLKRENYAYLFDPNYGL